MTQLRHVAETKAWDPTTLPDWLTEETYREKIQPRLAKLTVPAIAAAIGISKPYTTDIRAGRRVPIKTTHRKARFCPLVALTFVAGFTGN